MKTCPACQKAFDSGKYSGDLPFCSERCRLIDLGAWLTEKHKIAGNEPAPESFDTGNGDEPTWH